MEQLINNSRRVNIDRGNLSISYKKVFSTIKLIHQKRQTRKVLASLPQYLLDDLALSQNDVQCEVNKSFWISK